VLKYKEGYDLLTQQALKDNSEKVQQSAYWVLHGQKPYLSELFESDRPMSRLFQQIQFLVLPSALITKL
jgi:hypothetical protein